MKITSYTVLPDTPEKLKHLNDLAYNLYFAWNHEVLDLFKKLDPEIWEECNHSPVRMLSLVSQDKLMQKALDKKYLVELDAVYDRFQDYMEATTWFERQYQSRKGPVIAYLCAEYGLNKCMPVYSGGLGALAGDHMKSASDLGLPVVGVGLLYRQGYFSQKINADGYQIEHYPENDRHSMPVYRIKDDQGQPIACSVEIAGENVLFHIWRVNVGRIFIYLLDTNLRENDQKHRDITKQLYDPDRDTRIRQEILLGIGGIKALKIMGLEPTVYHLNEGHSAFSLLERLRVLIQEKGLTFKQAKEVLWTSTIFTTHTPVAAGNESFSTDLMTHYFKKYIQECGLTLKEFLSMGRAHPESLHEPFSMTIFSLRSCAFANGVSKLHGSISQEIWQHLYPGLSKKDVPIGSIVNGVHAKTWLNTNYYNLFLRYGGPSNVNEFADFTMWNLVDQIPDDELWDSHEANRRELVNFSRQRMKQQLQSRGAHAGEISNVNHILDPKALTLGFARRFTPYKRGHLFFRNFERVKKILCNAQYPVQIVVSGKAHPADHAGKDIIKQIFSFTTNPELKKHVVFLEDYDLDVARHIVQGVDVWLNTPRRPKEASGTSGMKAAMNGALNLSVLDGWWDEAYHPGVGWAVGERGEYEDENLQDDIESNQLYAILETEVIPLFYERDKNNIPLAWIQMMKNSMRELGTGYNSHRMLQDYIEHYYLRAELLINRLMADNFKETKELATWRDKLSESWGDIKIVKIEPQTCDLIYKGQELEVRAWVQLNQIIPQNVVVECYSGPLSNNYQIKHGKATPMAIEKIEENTTIFKTVIPCIKGGHFGFTVRVLPGHENLAVNTLPGFMKWYD